MTAPTPLNEEEIAQALKWADRTHSRGGWDSVYARVILLFAAQLAEARADLAIAPRLLELITAQERATAAEDALAEVRAVIDDEWPQFEEALKRAAAAEAEAMKWKDAFIKAEFRGNRADSALAKAREALEKIAAFSPDYRSERPIGIAREALAVIGEEKPRDEASAAQWAENRELAMKWRER